MAAAITLDRLRHAVAQHVVAPATEPPPGPDADLLRAILRVERHETPAGPVYLRDDWYAPSHQHGALPLEAPLAADPAAVAMILGAGEAPPGHRLAYFDIETTGLAGGTGTYVIVAGLGSFEADGYRLRQYFLADVGDERAMLAALADDLARFEGVVTYNGRAFDLPCLEARLTLARLPSPCGRLAHLDLLTAVRRLYRHRMPGCKLSDAERRLLRIERIDDIPGSLIPGMYFDYARAGRVAPLRAVFRHNAEDVLSMAGILARLAGLLAEGDGLEPEDAAAVARWWERAGDERRAMALYRDALPWLVGGEDWAWAAARHARLCRRAGLRDEAVEQWSALWREGDPSAGLELAKHHEHRARDYARAASIVSSLMARCDAAVALGVDQDALEHRLARIRTKAARWGSRS
jgi:uncharacterized protein YprB with RNaseH-like and TPR domain